MTSKTDILEQLAANEKKMTEALIELKSLRKIIEQPEQPRLWRPEKNEDYCFICAHGYSGVVLNDSRFDEKVINFGNCYSSSDEAEKAAPFISRAHKVCAAALQVDPDAGEWGPTSRPYTVYRNDAEWYSMSHIGQTGRICVHTADQANQMAAILNAEGV